MELTAGYKLSDIGIIPQDWEVSTVGTEFTLQLGKMLDAERNKGVYKPYLGNRAVQWERIDTNMLPTMAMSTADLKKYRLAKGDLLVCEGGDVGRAAIWDAPIDECYFQKALHRLRSRSGLDAKFMVVVLQRWVQTGLLSNYVTQTSIAHLPRDKFLLVPIPCPPSVEQSAIVDTLSDVSSLLDMLNRLIAKKHDLKQAAMQLLLSGRSRLPGFCGRWAVKRLGDVITRCFSGATPRRHRPNYYKGMIPWITSGELRYNIIGDTAERVSREAVAQTNLPIVPAGTFLMAITGMEAEGTRGACAISGIQATMNQSCMAVIPTRELSAQYLFHYYRFRGKELAVEYSQGTKQQSYTARLVKQLPIELPPSIDEQIAIAAVLSDMDAEIAALEARRDKTRMLKQAMMQELLTGRTRLVDPPVSPGAHAEAKPQMPALAHG